MCVKDSIGWVEVDKQQVAAPEVVETVVGLAHAGMSPATGDFEALQSATLTRGECLMVCVWVPNLHEEMDQNDYCGETRSG